MLGPVGSAENFAFLLYQKSRGFTSKTTFSFSHDPKAITPAEKALACGPF
jgi:hypothetical protein